MARFGCGRVVSEGLVSVWHWSVIPRIIEVRPSGVYDRSTGLAIDTARYYFDKESAFHYYLKQIRHTEYRLGAEAYKRGWGWELSEAQFQRVWRIANG